MASKLDTTDGRGDRELQMRHSGFAEDAGSFCCSQYILKHMRMVYINFVQS